jgi:antirestriction protein
MEAKLYVGTYSKYNAGRLTGKWLDLTEYSDKEEFYEACQEFHKDEEDPEFMFQDYEGILHDMPSWLIEESYIDSDVFDYLQAFENDEERAEAFFKWVKYAGYKGDYYYLMSKFEEAYEGKYSSPEDYAEYLVEEMGILKAMGRYSYYFDYSAFARDLFMTDYMYLDGVVYRNL